MISRSLARIGLALTLSAGCTTTEDGRDARPVPEPAASPSDVPSAEPDEVLPRYTELERDVMRLVRATGATDVGVAEPAHGDSDADISAEWKGRPLILLAYPTSNAEIYERRRKVLAETTVEGITVLEAEQVGKRLVAVECGAYTYKVTSYVDVPWNVRPVTDFVVALAKSAGC